MSYTTTLISKKQNKTHVSIYIIIYKLKLLLKLILYFTFPNFIFICCSFLHLPLQIHYYS